MFNVNTVQFPEFADGRGNLSFIEATRDIPFEIKRIYYITGVPRGADRGFHSHYDLHQILICLNGSVKIRCESDVREEYILNSPADGLYIGPMVWREMTEFSEQAVLLVLASDFYIEKDYIRDYKTFRQAANKYLEGIL